MLFAQELNKLWPGNFKHTDFNTTQYFFLVKAAGQQKKVYASVPKSLRDQHQYIELPIGQKSTPNMLT
jgi:hypothetical protein